MNDQTAPLPLIEPELRTAMLADFVMSSADWSRRASEARQRGDIATARTFEAVARVADDVARGKV